MCWRGGWAATPAHLLSLRDPRADLDFALALFPATQRKAVPGVLVGRNAVTIGISKDEGAPERTIKGWLNDGGSSRFHFGMQLIDMIAVDPERHTPSRMRCFIQVNSWL